MSRDVLSATRSVDWQGLQLACRLSFFFIFLHTKFRSLIDAHYSLAVNKPPSTHPPTLPIHLVSTQGLRPAEEQTRVPVEARLLPSRHLHDGVPD